MLLADKLLPNPPLLLLCSCARASAARTSAPCYSSSSCCRTCTGPASHARPGLAAPLLRTPEPRASLARAASDPFASARTKARPHRGRALRGRMRQATAVRGLAAPRAGLPRAAAPHLHPRARACALQHREPRARSSTASPARIHADSKRAEGGRQGGNPQREAPPVGKKKGRQREEEQRGRRNRISQGLMRKFIKLQGPLGKVKFHINLKP
jgi:hypothetical protein